MNKLSLWRQLYNRCKRKFGYRHIHRSG